MLYHPQFHQKLYGYYRMYKRTDNSANRMLTTSSHHVAYHVVVN